MKILIKGIENQIYRVYDNNGAVNVLRAKV